MFESEQGLYINLRVVNSAEGANLVEVVAGDNPPAARVQHTDTVVRRPDVSEHCRYIVWPTFAVLGLLHHTSNMNAVHGRPVETWLTRVRMCDCRHTYFIEKAAWLAIAHLLNAGDLVIDLSRLCASLMVSV